MNQSPLRGFLMERIEERGRHQGAPTVIFPEITLDKRTVNLYSEQEVKTLLATLINTYNLALAENGFSNAVNETKFNLKDWWNNKKK